MADSPTPARTAPERVENSTTRSSRRGLAIGLVTVIGVIVLALVAWFVVVPALRAHPTEQNSESPSATSDSPWALIAAVTPPSGSTDVSVSATGAANIVTLEWWYGGGHAFLQGLDMSTSQVRWSTLIDNNTTFAYGDFIYASDLERNRVAIDVYTGQVETSPAPQGDIQYSDATYVIVADDHDYGYCGALLKDLGTCLWRAIPLMGAEAVVFGGNKWIDTRDGVINIADGTPAPFGADVADMPICDDGACDHHMPPPGVYYDGPQADSILRFTMSGSESVPGTIQSWDVTTNKARGKVVKLSGDPCGAGMAPPSLFTCSGGYIYPGSGEGTNPTTLTAYSWQSGQKQWQVDLPDISYIRDIESVGSGLFVGNYASMVSDDESAVILDPATGQQLWSGMGYGLLMGGPTVAYLVKDGVLHALDVSSGSFTDL